MKQESDEHDPVLRQSISLLKTKLNETLNKSDTKRKKLLEVFKRLRDDKEKKKENEKDLLKLKKKILKNGKGRLNTFVKRDLDELEKNFVIALKMSKHDVVQEVSGFALKTNVLKKMIEECNEEVSERLDIDFVRYYIALLQHCSHHDGIEVRITDNDTKKETLKALLEDKAQLSQKAVVFVKEKTVLEGAYYVDSTTERLLKVAYFDPSIDHESMSTHMRQSFVELFGSESSTVLVVGENSADHFGGGRNPRTFNTKNDDLYILFFLFNKIFHYKTMVHDRLLIKLKEQLILAAVTKDPQYI